MEFYSQFAAGERDVVLSHRNFSTFPSFYGYTPLKKEISSTTLFRFR